MYQPVPFLEYKDLKSQRKDCEERYQVIKKSYGDFKGQSLIDICCANGFFGFRFLQDGGLIVRGVETRRSDREFIDNLAIEKKMRFVCFDYLPKHTFFDIGIYLDTHYHGTTVEDGYLEFLLWNTKVSFISAAENRQEFFPLLQKMFEKVETIYRGFQGRIIYRCE